MALNIPPSAAPGGPEWEEMRNKILLWEVREQKRDISSSINHGRGTEILVMKGAKKKYEKRLWSEGVGDKNVGEIVFFLGLTRDNLCCNVSATEVSFYPLTQVTVPASSATYPLHNVLQTFLKVSNRCLHHS